MLDPTVLIQLGQPLTLDLPQTRDLLQKVQLVLKDREGMAAGCGLQFEI
jgi:hypothetical protein